MKLSKMLKLKNKIAGRMGQIKSKIETYNVTDARTKNPYNAAELLEELTKLAYALAFVKAAVSLSNAGIQNPPEKAILDSQAYRIFMIAELKGIVAMLQSLNTQESTRLEMAAPGQFVEVAITASIKQQAADAVIADAEKRIEELQDGIDAYNATVQVDAVVDSWSGLKN